MLFKHFGLTDMSSALKNAQLYDLKQKNYHFTTFFDQKAKAKRILYEAHPWASLCEQVLNRSRRLGLVDEQAMDGLHTGG